MTRHVATLRRVLLALVLLCAISTATNILIARTLGVLLIELRQDHAATVEVRAAYLVAEQRQAEALDRASIESRRLAALICQHLVRTGGLSKPCPAP